MRWRNVTGYEGSYFVSDEGLLINEHGKVLLPQLTGGVYPYTRLRKGRIFKKLYFHQIVAEAFLGSKPPKAEVRHRDGDCKNYKSTNLCWGTRSQNNLDKVLHGTAKRKFTSLQITDIRKKHQDAISMQCIANEYAVSVNTIFQIIHRRVYAEI
jgi:hypothetical protein